jgi:hypothetical protein
MADFLTILFRVNSASAPKYRAAQLAPLKQCSPKSRIRYRGSATPEGEKKFMIRIKFAGGGWEGKFP